MAICPLTIFSFFFNDTSTTEIYTLSLHDALPILKEHIGGHPEWESDTRLIGARGKDQVIFDIDEQRMVGTLGTEGTFPNPGDRKSTRLNSSHGYISYAVFCLKKKKKQITPKRIDT